MKEIELNYSTKLISLFSFPFILPENHQFLAVIILSSPIEMGVGIVRKGYLEKSPKPH